MRHITKNDIGKQVLTYWGSQEEGGYKRCGVTLISGLVISVGKKFFQVFCQQNTYRTNGNRIYKVSMKRFPEVG